MESKETSSTGLSPNMAAGMSYILGFITGVIFYLIEKDDKFVRFHAMQSIWLSGGEIVLLVVLAIVGAALGFIPVIGGIIGILVFLLNLVVYIGGFVLWLVCIIKAFQGGTYKIPFIATLAEKYV